MSITPWQHIFNTYHILSNLKTKNFRIKAIDIKNCKSTYKSKKISQFEPRLLCYQTTEKERPEIFKENNVCILPIKNGEYLLTKQNIFYKLDYINTNNIKLKKDETSILNELGESETTIINNLKYSGLFETKTYMNETITHSYPLFGRHYCSFKMNLNNEEICVDGVQYEIDGTFESENKILLIECKNSPKKIDSFNIRQLYYPYRAIYDKIQNKKEIICIYIHKLKDIVYIWKFKFNDYQNLNSIECIGSNSYIFLSDKSDKGDKSVKSNKKKESITNSSNSESDSDSQEVIKKVPTKKVPTKVIKKK
jgi:hypothetical protein